MFSRVVFCVAFACLLAAFSGCGKAKIERIEWATMGTVAAVQTRGEGGTFLKGVREVAQLYYGMVVKEFDVHNPESQIRRFGHVSPFGICCEQAARTLQEQSGGAFNPGWRRDGIVDYGAIAKGYAVDCAALNVWNGEDVLLDLGGNLKSVCGEWKVGIAESDLVITLTNGMACATSAEYFRGKHIYDGRTGLAVTNGLKSVTVVHPTSAMLADGLSTTLFILGQAEGEAFLKKYYPEARAYWVTK